MHRLQSGPRERDSRPRLAGSAHLIAPSRVVSAKSNSLEVPAQTRVFLNVILYDCGPSRGLPRSVEQRTAQPCTVLL